MKNHLRKSCSALIDELDSFSLLIIPNFLFALSLMQFPLWPNSFEVCGTLLLFSVLLRTALETTKIRFDPLNNVTKITLRSTEKRERRWEWEKHYHTKIRRNEEKRERERGEEEDIECVKEDDKKARYEEEIIIWQIMVEKGDRKGKREKIEWEGKREKESTEKREINYEKPNKCRECVKE